MTEIDWDQFRRDSCQFQQLKALQDIQKKLATTPGPRTPAPPAAAEKPKSFVRCPHCGGDLPSDSEIRRYPKCKNCGGELYWYVVSIGSLSASKPFASRLEADSHVASRLLADISCASSPNRHTTGFCIYACGVIAAFDGKLSKEEIDVVVEGLSWTGMSRDGLTSQFIKACQRIHGDGVDAWIDRLTAMMRDGEGNHQTTGMLPLELLRLMQRLFTLSGGDTTNKAAAFRRLAKVIASG